MRVNDVEVDEDKEIGEVPENYRRKYLKKTRGRRIKRTSGRRI